MARETRLDRLTKTAKKLDAEYIRITRNENFGSPKIVENSDMKRILDIIVKSIIRDHESYKKLNSRKVIETGPSPCIEYMLREKLLDKLVAMGLPTLLAASAVHRALKQFVLVCLRQNDLQNKKRARGFLRLLRGLCGQMKDPILASIFFHLRAQEKKSIWDRVRRRERQRRDLSMVTLPPLRTPPMTPTNSIRKEMKIEIPKKIAKDDVDKRHKEDGLVIFNVLIPFINDDGPEAEDALETLKSLCQLPDVAIAQYVAKETSLARLLVRGLEYYYKCIRRAAHGMKPPKASPRRRPYRRIRRRDGTLGDFEEDITWARKRFFIRLRNIDEFARSTYDVIATNIKEEFKKCFLYGLLIKDLTLPPRNDKTTAEHKSSNTSEPIRSSGSFGISSPLATLATSLRISTGSLKRRQKQPDPRIWALKFTTEVMEEVKDGMIQDSIVDFLLEDRPKMQENNLLIKSKEDSESNVEKEKSVEQDDSQQSSEDKTDPNQPSEEQKSLEVSEIYMEHNSNVANSSDVKEKLQVDTSLPASKYLDVQDHPQIIGILIKYLKSEDGVIANATLELFLQLISSMNEEVLSRIILRYVGANSDAFDYGSDLETTLEAHAASEEKGSEEGIRQSLCIEDIEENEEMSTYKLNARDEVASWIDAQAKWKHGTHIRLDPAILSGPLVFSGGGKHKVQNDDDVVLDNRRNSEDYAKVFLRILCSKIRNLLKNSLDTNLLITGILSKLAACPDRALHIFLFKSTFEPADRKAHPLSALAEVWAQARKIQRKISNFGQIALRTKKRLDKAGKNERGILEGGVGSRILHGIILLEEFIKEMIAISKVKADILKTSKLISQHLEERDAVFAKLNSSVQFPHHSRRVSVYSE
eukprot:jgi/Bigna1/135549/aug1.30_g10257